MSVHVSSWVWKHSKAKDHQLLVLLALADMANDEGKCWPSIRTICERCRISERSARGAVNQASANGELKILAQEGPNWVNVYQFTAFIPPAESAPPLLEATPRPAKSAPLPPAESAPPPAKLDMTPAADFAPRNISKRNVKETTTPRARAAAKGMHRGDERQENVVVVFSRPSVQENGVPTLSEAAEQIATEFELKDKGRTEMHRWIEQRFWCNCVKKARERPAVRKMKVGPSEPPGRGRLQTTLSCCGQKPRW